MMSSRTWNSSHGRWLSGSRRSSGSQCAHYCVVSLPVCLLFLAARPTLESVQSVGVAALTGLRSPEKVLQPLLDFNTFDDFCDSRACARRVFFCGMLLDS